MSGFRRCVLEYLHGGGPTTRTDPVRRSVELWLGDTARQLISKTEYLCCERDSTIRHEWIGGVSFAMTGTSGVHNRIA